VSKKWLCVNKELAYNRTIMGTNKEGLINMGEFLDKDTHK
jgi:hypothetical protein